MKKTDSKLPILNYSLDKTMKIPSGFFSSKVKDSRFYYKNEPINPYKDEVRNKSSREDRMNFMNFGLGIRKEFNKSTKDLLGILARTPARSSRREWLNCFRTPMRNLSLRSRVWKWPTLWTRSTKPSPD